MKTRIKLAVAGLFSVPLLLVGTTALASATSGSDNSGSGKSSDSTSKDKTEVKPASTTTETEPSTDPKGILERVAKQKTELKAKLTAVEESKLKLRCKAAQTGGISSLSGRIKGVETSRTEVHKNIVDKLEKLSARLKEKSVDTTKLDAEIATLKTKIETFKTDLTAYKQAVSDLKNMDCAADPTAFKAALENARKLRDTLGTDAKAVRSYVTDTIKPTLKEIRATLEAKEKAENNSSSTTGGTN